MDTRIEKAEVNLSSVLGRNDYGPPPRPLPLFEIHFSRRSLDTSRSAQIPGPSGEALQQRGWRSSSITSATSPKSTRWEGKSCVPAVCLGPVRATDDSPLKHVFSLSLSLSFRTKLFIRFPKTLFATEDAFEYRKHLLSMYLGHAQKHLFLPEHFDKSFLCKFSPLRTQWKLWNPFGL